MSVFDIYDKCCYIGNGKLLIIKYKNYYYSFSESALVMHYLFKFNIDYIRKLPVIKFTNIDTIVLKLKNLNIMYGIYENGKCFYKFGDEGVYYDILFKSKKLYEKELLIKDIEQKLSNLPYEYLERIYNEL